MELCFLTIDTRVRDRISNALRADCKITQTPADAIEELNHRFRQAAVGYQYESGQIIWIDSGHLQTEITHVAFTLLRDGRFAGPNEEFHTAHKHLRKGETKQAITMANNAFESKLKTICALKPG